MSGFDKGTGVTHENPHARPSDLNPKVNGPFLDDIRKEQERAYREARNKKAVQADDTVEIEVTHDADADGQDSSN